MGKTIMGAVVSLDGFMADDNDGVGPMFDWFGNGDVSLGLPGQRRRGPHHPGLGRLHAGASTATWRRWSSDGGCST